MNTEQMIYEVQQSQLKYELLKKNADRIMEYIEDYIMEEDIPKVKKGNLKQLSIEDLKEFEEGLYTMYEEEEPEEGWELEEMEKNNERIHCRFIELLNKIN